MNPVENPMRERSVRELMVEVIQSPSSGLRLIAVAADLIAEHARYNMWALKMKSSASTREMWDIAAVADRCRTECLTAWQRYVSTSDKTAGTDELVRALVACTEKFRQAQEEGKAPEDSSIPDDLREWP